MPFSAMNATMERYVGSARREALDRIMVLRERHLRFALSEYVRHFNTTRPHRGLGQRVPVSAPRQTCDDASEVVAIAVLGGLHHDYLVAA